MEFIPIRVSTLRGDQKVNFNTYVFINNKSILYIRKGDSFEGTRLERLKKKKLKKMYIKQEDEKNYLNYLNTNIEIAYDSSSKKSIDDRSEIVQGLQEGHSEELMENPTDEVQYILAKKGTNKYVQFLLKEEKALSSMLNRKNDNKSVAHHGVSVSTLSTALAKRLGIEENKIEHIALGALIHDIGYLSLKGNFTKPVKTFTSEELQEYQRHPIIGAEQTKDLHFFDREVVKIILQHDENIDGSGFPYKIRGSAIDITALIVGSANALDRIITFEGINKEAATKKLMLEQVGRYPLEHIQLLQSIINSSKI